MNSSPAHDPERDRTTRSDNERLLQAVPRTHVSGILRKLNIGLAAGTNRRVTAVLVFLRGQAALSGYP